jgi:hypothetical protein
MLQKYLVMGIAFRRGSESIVNPFFSGYTWAVSEDKAVSNVEYRDNVDLRDVKVQLLSSPVKAHPVYEQISFLK